MRQLKISLQVNGKRHLLQVEPGETLLQVLRGRLGLTGTKNGCETGQCGACTVIMDGQAVNACLVLAFQAQGRSITTIEGIGAPERLHPLQEAFLDHGAVQCGFCTPGAVLAAKALLDANPKPTREEIQEALSGVLCRCTGYEPIIQAVEAVAGGSRGEPVETRVDATDGRSSPGPAHQAAWAGGAGKPRLSDIGTSLVEAPPVRRLDGLEKVTGSTKFAGDLVFTGMLHARTLRSKVPHGRLLALRTEKAAKAKGVVAVLTAKDVPGAARYGVAVADQWVLVPVGEPVRMVGDPLALVAAESEAAAEAALELVEVEYQELPVLASPGEALSPGATPLHDGKDDNVCVRLSQAQGDPDQALALGDVLAERSYRTPIQEHAFLEPEVAVAVPERDGSLSVYCATQSPFPIWKMVADALGLPKDRVRLVTTTAGGAFGGKADLHAQVHAALLAHRTGRPVRIRWSRQESILAHPKRHPLHLHGRLAAGREGRLTALEATVVGDAGAYTGYSSIALFMTLSFMTGPYYFPHFRASGLMAFTNNPNSGLLRGMGGLIANTLRESLLDALARRLGIDPAELRRRNILPEGAKPGFPGMVLDGRMTAEEAMDKAVAAAGSLERPSGPGRSTGRGLCLAMPPFQIGAPPRSASARVELLDDGSAVVYAGVSEMGNGVTTTLAQMVAGELGLQPQQVQVVFGDTARCPAGTPAVGSGQTYTTGNALRLATLEVKARLAEEASRLLEAPPAIMLFKEGQIMASEAPHRRIPLAQAVRACRERGLSLTGEATFAGSHAGWGHTFACTVADVEVDRETGDVRVLQVVSALDTGPVLNRQNVVGQMLGAAVQAQGFATMEEVVVEKAVPLTRGLEEYRIPTMMDIPVSFTPVTIEEPYPTGPYGIKGVGEHGIYTVGPAILCAVENALDVRLEGFPATPERVLRALRSYPKTP